MNSVDQFKSFVKNKPSLVKYVNDGTMNWQKFYDMWYLYGANNDIWNKYNVVEEVKQDSPKLSDFLGMFKNVDMESVRGGIEGLQKAIGLFLDMSNRNTTNLSNNLTREQYSPRGAFRRFED